MPYYSAKQPQEVPVTAGSGKQVDGSLVMQIMTDDRDVPYLHLYEADRIIICKQRQARIVFGFFSKVLTVVSLWMGGSLVLLGLHPGTQGNAAFHTVSAFIVSLVAVSLWLRAGPDDLEIDLRERTYWYRRGLLHLAPTLTGTLKDITTISIETADESDRRWYCLVLTWNLPGRRSTHLGKFRTLEQADEQRTRLLDKLAL